MGRESKKDDFKRLKDMLLSHYSDQPTECKIIKKATRVIMTLQDPWYSE